MTQLNIAVPSLVVLVGISGAGKSSFARKLFAATEVLSSDRFRALISDSENDQSVTMDAFDLLARVAEMRLRRGRLCVIDATNIEPIHRMKYIDLGKQFGCPVSAIVLQPSLEESLERRAGRGDRDISVDSLLQQYTKFLEHVGTLQDEGFSPIWRLGGSEAFHDVIAIQRVTTESTYATDSNVEEL